MKTNLTPLTVQNISVALRRYLYFTAAITGAAILIVEILGARMLSPYVGASHFVWTAQIMVTLAALAAGYYAGGRLVDRSPRLEWLYGCILAAAIYLCLTVLICEPVAFACLRFNLAIGSLLISMFLFFAPLTLLAMTGPFLIRILTHSISNVGGNVGRLYAISTAGSLIGAGFISYVCIPLLANSVTMDGAAGLLMAVTAGYFFIWGRENCPKSLILAGILIGVGSGYAGVMVDRQTRFADTIELYRRNSPFGLLHVIESRDGKRRWYLNNYATLNDYDPVQKKGIEMFSYLLHGLARAYTPRTEAVLCIGMGAGLVPMDFAREGAQVDVLEINPAVPGLAANYFDCDLHRLNIAIGDGRYFLNRATRKYDAVILDAFVGESPPAHLMTRETFHAIRQILKTDGTLVMNTLAKFEPGKDFLCASVDKTLQTIFKSVRIHADGSGNVFFVASDQPGLKILRPPNFERVHPVCRKLVETAFAMTPRTNPEHGLVLTDDYNPIEFYDSANREELRRKLAEAIRQQVKKRS
ncbi:MAG: fused MFS/spermidine synthase [Verrucomicrobia bacterium]|nr:fused MFS/spermidine synthase [Verrucomicrobiota bacterium]